MNSTYEFTCKDGPKVKLENIWGVNSRIIFLVELKQKFGIFIRTKNIFNPKNNMKYIYDIIV